MATYDLTISLANDTITIYLGNQVANALTVQPGDVLQFTSERQWAVQFISEGPPGSSGRSSPPLNLMAVSGAPNISSSVTVNQNAQRGTRWDYVACVLNDSGGISTVDPDIVIAERG